MDEFALIDRIRARAPARDDVALGIGDDCALLDVPAGLQLAITSDTLNAGVHFPLETAPFDIGWKALAVNLSDLAAMGARPAWCTLALALPQADAEFVEGFLDGFFALARLHEVALVGGDTTRGPLSINVTAHGLVAPGTALRRDGAQAGDDVWVSGTLGDAAAGLAQWKAGDPSDAFLRTRLDRPTPRVALGQSLGGIATACIDLSDGLLADLGHICRASSVGARIDVEVLPTSEALATGFDVATRRHLQATGGDDYELCFTALPTRRQDVLVAACSSGVAVTRIGGIERESAGLVLCVDGDIWLPPHAGFVHFG